MSITLPQTPVGFQLSGVTFNSAAFGSNVTAGSLVVVTIAKPVTTSRTFSVTDDRSAVYTQAVANDANSFRQCEIWYSENHPGGATTVTVSIGTGTTSCDVCLYEVTGAATSDVVSDFDSLDTTVNSNTFYQANTTGFNVGAGEICFAVQVLNGTVTTITKDADYTLAASSTAAFGAGAFLHQYLINSGSAITDERPTVTTTGTARQGPGCCAVFKVAASGGIFPHYMDQLTGGFQVL